MHASHCEERVAEISGKGQKRSFCACHAACCQIVNLWVGQMYKEPGQRILKSAVCNPLSISQGTLSTKLSSSLLLHVLLMPGLPKLSSCESPLFLVFFRLLVVEPTPKDKGSFVEEFSTILPDGRGAPILHRSVSCFPGDMQPKVVTNRNSYMTQTRL